MPVHFSNENTQTPPWYRNTINILFTKIFCMTFFLSDIKAWLNFLKRVIEMTFGLHCLHGFNCPPCASCVYNLQQVVSKVEPRWFNLGCQQVCMIQMFIKHSAHSKKSTFYDLQGWVLLRTSQHGFSFHWLLVSCDIYFCQSFSNFY